MREDLLIQTSKLSLCTCMYGNLILSGTSCMYVFCTDQILHSNYSNYYLKDTPSLHWELGKHHTT